MTADGRIVPTDGQVAKLRRDMQQVQVNVNVLGELLSDIPAGTRVPHEGLLKDLQIACKEMHRRMMMLVDAVGNDALVGEYGKGERMDTVEFCKLTLVSSVSCVCLK